MPGPVFTNNAVGTLAAAAGPTDTALTLGSGQGNAFPSPGVDEWFSLTIVNVSNQIEIVHVTARAGDIFTVLRGQENTAARALGLGEKCEHRLTAGGLNAIRDRPLDPGQIPDLSITGPKLATGAVSTGKIANGAVGGAQLFQGPFISNTFLTAGAALANLGYTPVQQGGGNGQTLDKIFLGWTGQGKLKVTVGSTDIGYVLNERDDGNPRTAGYRGTPHTEVTLHYVLGVQDAGTTIILANGEARTFVLSDYATVPFLPGIRVKLMNRSGVLTIAGAAGVDVFWSPNGVIGPRILAAGGICWVEKVSANLWWVYGYGLS